MGVKKKFFKEIMHFHYDFYGHTLAQEPMPRGHESYSFGRPLLGYHYYILSLSDLLMKVEKKIF